MEYIIKNINDYDNEEIKSFYKKIPMIKKKRIDKYINNEAKERSIIGEILLYNLMLKKNIAYEKQDYYINKYGKPYFKSNSIYFNISHSFDYIITIISNKKIGIDIEKIRETPLNAINQFATKKEKEYILSSNNNIEERLFKIYTLKEAYFKMLGTNLNNILEVEFSIKQNEVSCSDKNVKIGFINEIEGYVISYCEMK